MKWQRNVFFSPSPPTHWADLIKHGRKAESYRHPADKSEEGAQEQRILPVYNPIIMQGQLSGSEHVSQLPGTINNENWKLADRRGFRALNTRSSPVSPGPVRVGDGSAHSYPV